MPQLASNGEVTDCSGASAISQGNVIPTPDSQSASSSDSGSTPSPFQVCKVGESPANSPGGRRGSESNGSSRSRDRSTCVVPSPLAASCPLEDIDSELAGTNGPPGRPGPYSAKMRKDFSRLFVPIPPSPGSMDCCTADCDESTASSGKQDHRLKEDSAPSMPFCFILLLE